MAGYISLNLAALIAAVEFGIQPLLFHDINGVPLYNPYGLNIAIPAMVIPHLLVAGVIEGLVTVWVYSYVKKFSPEMIYQGDSGGSGKLLYLLLTFIAATPLGLLASGTAWGEWNIHEIRADLGYIPRGFLDGIDPWVPLPDYTIGSFNEVLSYTLSAAIGVGIIFVAVRAFFYLEKKEV